MGTGEKKDGVTAVILLPPLLLPPSLLLPPDMVSFVLASLLQTLLNLSVPAGPTGAQLDTVISHIQSDFQGTNIFCV